MKLMEAGALVEKLHKDIANDVKEFSFPLSLSIILVGNDPMSELYVSKKEALCKKLGIDAKEYRFLADARENIIVQKILELNRDVNVTGILVQLPLPGHLDTKKILSTIHPLKDVDGLHPVNFGYLCSGYERICPCTPKGVVALIEHYGIDFRGKNVAVIGRSSLVGRPLAMMLTNRDATVTLCHTKTNDLKKVLMGSDIIVSAAGSPHIVDCCKDGAIVVNVGMSKVDDNVVGDVHIKNLSNAEYVTPISRCIGLLTITMLLTNVIECAKLQGGMT